MKKSIKTRERMETSGDRSGRQGQPVLHSHEAGEVVEEGSFRNQVSSIEKHFGGERERVALEAGAQSAWISRELSGWGTR